MFQKSMFQSKINNKPKVYLGIDYGLVHTGTALSKDGVTSPYKTINSKNFNHLLSELHSIIVKEGITNIIVGIPLSHDGKENKQSLEVRKAINNLKKYIKLPIEYYNEYGTTYSNTHISSGYHVGISTKKKEKIDQYSASSILESYLIDNR